MKEESYSQFWQKIHSGAKAKNFPLRVMFELTYQCNFSCPHCYVPQSYKDKKGELNTRQVFSILDQLKAIGCFYLGFTGGEPFMRKDIIQILRYAKKCGFELIIYSNGSLINKKIVDQLKKLQLNKIDITIPAMSQENFERISGVQGSRNKVFKAIDMLGESKIALGFKTCVLKENQDEIKDIQEFADSLGALHRLDDTLSRRLNGDDEPFKYRGSLPLVTSHRSQVTSKNKIEECTQRKTHSAKRTALFKCGVGQSQAAITPWGELKPCLMIDQPRYKIVSSLRSAVSGLLLREAWGKLKMWAAQIKPDKNYKCATCKLKNYCKWCPARSWLYNKSFTVCVPENRKRAEK